MEHWGCIYERPPPKRPGDRDITVHEIKRLNFVGLPIRVEHFQGDIGVVTEQRTDPVSGKTDVKFKLHSTPEGFAAKTLIGSDTIKQLSLKHLLYPDRQIVPQEISLCLQGARPNTDIYKHSTALPIEVAMSAETATAAPMATEPVAPVAAPTPVRGETPQQTAPMTSADAVSKKRSFEDMVSETMSAMNVTTPEAKKAFMDFAVEQAKREFALLENNHQLVNANKQLESKYSDSQRLMENSSEQIAQTIHKLYQWALGEKNPLSDEDVAKCSTAIQEASPEIKKLMQPMVVACSAIMERAADRTQNTMQTEIDSLQKQVAFYSQSFDHMGGRVWTPAAPAPAPAAAPVVVAASAQAAPAPPSQSPLSQANDVAARLRQTHGNYNTSGVVDNKMPLHMLPRSFAM